MRITDKEGLLAEEFLIGEMLGQVEVYCECVTLGCKPMASIMVRKRHLPLALEHIVLKDCQYWVDEQSDSDEWVDVYIYVLANMGQVIQELWLLMSAEEESTALFEWVKGKLFGYGNAEIATHIDQWGASRDDLASH